MIKQKGTTIIELVLVVLGVGFLVLIIGNLPNSLTLVGRSQKVSLAREIAARQIEEKRQIGYANLTFGSEPVVDARLNMLPYGGGTVEVADCDVNLCVNGESAKSVSVEVTWKENGKDEKVTLKTLVAQEGLN